MPSIDDMMIEPPDLDKSLEAAKSRIYSVPMPECEGCTQGIDMCHNVPCIGTPQEIQVLIDKGYANNLMLDYWMGSDKVEESRKFNPFKEDVVYLKPAIQGRGGKGSPLYPCGTCELLTSDSKCSVHNIKPIQGRIACCKSEEAHRKYDERYDILRLWNTEAGLELIANWKKLVNYDDDDPNNNSRINPSTADIFDALFRTLLG